MKNIFKLIISVWLPLLVWFTASYFTRSSVDTWYLILEKPIFNPLSWVFWPVWTILYILIWISFYLVWKKNFWVKKNRKYHISFLLTKGKDAWKADRDISELLSIYFFQLLLNFTWSFMFFGLQNPFYWLINIILLLVVIIVNILVFYKVSKKAAYLLIPYFLWVSFATILNFSIYYLNY